MKRILSIIICTLLLTSAGWAQVRMTDSQVMQFVLKERAKGTSQSQIVSRLLQRGVTASQIRRLRKTYQDAQKKGKKYQDGDLTTGGIDTEDRIRYNNGGNDRSMFQSQDAFLEGQAYTGQFSQGRIIDYTRQHSYDENDPDFVEMDEAMNEWMPQDTASLVKSLKKELARYRNTKKVFGRDMFNKKYLTFEPEMNIATPQSYVLGPGDMVNIDIWGASSDQISTTISPDGTITVENGGVIELSGLTVAQAKQRLRSRLGQYYQDSQIQMTLGQTRTITVNVLGEVKKPGSYTLSAFASVFHALHMAGGVGDLGTLRNIKVFRGGRLLSVVDVYDYMLNGKLTGNVRLADNDIIQVGTYDNLVNISGKVKRPMWYEMKGNESLATLLRYSGGYKGDAFTKYTRVYRKANGNYTVFNVEEFDANSFRLYDNDSVCVDSLIPRYENMVEVKGAVFRPGMYNLGEKVSSVRSLIENADGLTEEAMVSRAVLRRMKPNRTQEVMSVDLKGILEGTSADVPLENEDVLFIPTQAEHQNLRTLSIDGEVIFPGTYEYADKMTVEDLILQAGGLTDNASTVKVDVARRMIDPEATTATMEIAKTFSFQLKPGFEMDGDRSFTLMPYDVVSVRRSPVSADLYKVRVEGEVAFEGSYTLSQKNQRLSDVIKAAGGVVPGAYVRGARLVRTMNEDERARMQEVVKAAKQSATVNTKDTLNLDMLDTSTTYLVGIHLDEALANPGCDEDVELQDGDVLVVPRFNHTVKISGDILKPNTVAFKNKMNYKYYIEQAGGYGKRARKSKTYILYQNGTIAKASKGKIEPGCEIVVPTKGPRDPNAITNWLGIGTSAASLATMFVSIANMIKK